MTCMFGISVCMYVYIQHLILVIKTSNLKFLLIMYICTYVLMYIFNYVKKNSLGLLKKARPSKVKLRALPGT